MSDYVNTLLSEAATFANNTISILNEIPPEDIDVYVFIEKATDIADLCELYPTVRDVSPLISYFVLSRCHFLFEELGGELVIIKNVIEAKAKKGVNTPIDPSKIIKHWRENVCEIGNDIDFTGIRDRLCSADIQDTQDVLVSSIGEFRKSVYYDSMPEELKTEALLLLDELLLGSVEEQLLAVRGIFCITVED